jgi:hypothetical protein
LSWGPPHRPAAPVSAAPPAAGPDVTLKAHPRPGAERDMYSTGGRISLTWINSTYHRKQAGTTAIRATNVTRSNAAAQPKVGSEIPRWLAGRFHGPRGRAPTLAIRVSRAKSMVAGFILAEGFSFAFGPMKYCTRSGVVPTAVAVARRRSARRTSPSSSKSGVITHPIPWPACGGRSARRPGRS